MPGFRKPKESDFLDDRSFSTFVNEQHKYANGPPRTTASLQGTPQYATTSFTVSDILQGTFNVKDQSDTLLVINKALTQDLSGLYDVGADGISSFSTAKPAAALSGTGTANPNAAVPGDSTGAGGTAYASPVKREWVASLPLQAPNSTTLIWRRQGKGSREMHLGLSNDMSSDIKNHLQHKDMPKEWQFPYNMDRDASEGRSFSTDPVVGSDGYVKYWEGGETIIGSSGKTIGNENPDLPGPGGAFGYLSPLEEQYYISMAWPFKGVEGKFSSANLPDIASKCLGINKSSYRGKKVLVFSVKTNAAVVCTPGDWGPNPYYTTGSVNKDSIEGFIAGLSPDVHFVLGTNHGDEFMLGWMPDNTPLGPYKPTADQALVTSSPTAPAAIGGGGQNTIEELIFAGNRIANHPNNWMVKDGKRVPGVDNYSKNMRATLTTGVKANPNGEEVLYKDAQGNQFLMPALLNYLWLILEGGFILDGYVGAIGHKQKLGDKSQLSNHASGGAIDIGALGRAREGRVYAFTDHTNCRPIADELFSYLASLPRNTKPEEVGCSFAYTYGNGFRVFKDANPTHLHLGFDLTEAGTLMRPLKKTSSTSGLTST